MKNKTLLEFLFLLPSSFLLSPGKPKKNLLHWQLLLFARKLASMHCILLNTLTIHFPNFSQSQITLTVFAILENHPHKRPTNCDPQARPGTWPVFALPMNWEEISHFLWLKHKKKNLNTHLSLYLYQQPSDTFTQTSVFINIVLLRHSQAHLFTCCP